MIRTNVSVMASHLKRVVRSTSSRFGNVLRYLFLVSTAGWIGVTAAGVYSGESDMQAEVIVGGSSATLSLTVNENKGIHPNSPKGTQVFTLTTANGGTRQGVKINNVCPPAGCAVKATWTLQLNAAGTTTDDDGYTYAETGPTTYKALLQSTGPIEPGQYTVKIETLWIY